MPVISIFSGDFCQKDRVVEELKENTGFQLVTDADLVQKAATLSGLAESKIQKAFSWKTSVFNSFTYEKERARAWLRLAVAQVLTESDKIILEGFCAQLPPQKITHVLRTCLIADIAARVSEAVKQNAASEKNAPKLIQNSDKNHASWIEGVYGITDETDPWSPSFFDMVLPTDKKGPEHAASTIFQQLTDENLKVTPSSQQAVNDFLLAAQVETVLISHGHNVLVDATDGNVSLTINKHVLLLKKLEQELTSIASDVEGVNEVSTKVGKGFHRTDIYRQMDFEGPNKILLVDDQREFVETLSERLSMRGMGAHVVYDGPAALDTLDQDAPEVIVLDLKMPGMDGVEVLRRVKENTPDVEVIILTGHESAQSRAECEKLGAFAYMEKPVDIAELSETVKQAHAKAQKKA